MPKAPKFDKSGFTFSYRNSQATRIGHCLVTKWPSHTAAGNAVDMHAYMQLRPSTKK